MFWRRRSDTTPTHDHLFGLSEAEQHETAQRLVVSGTWRSDDADVALRLARRLDAFVASALVLQAVEGRTVEAAPRQQRRRAKRAA